MKKIFLPLIAFFLFSTISLVNAAVFNVTNYTGFWNALDSAANNGEDDVINLAAGTYNITWPLSYYTDENRQLTIQGAGVGVTILDGGGTYKILDLVTSHDGLGDDGNSHITVRTLTFSNGHAANSVTGLEAGGLAVHTKSANITLENCAFENNYASQNGGGANLSTSYGTISMENCLFTNNSAIQKGGGTYLSSKYGTATVTNVTFTQNSIENPNGGSGGGLYMYAKTQTLIDNIFENNQGGFYGLGGGAYIWASNVSQSVVSLTNNSFNNNSTGGVGDGFGGGVFINNEGIETTLTNNTFSGNTASYGAGGGAYLRINNSDGASSAILTRNKFINNSADSGGGFWVEGVEYLTLTVTNNVSKNNSFGIRGGGGGIQLSPSYQNELSFINNTIVNNYAVNNYQVTTEGGGLYVDSGNGIVDFYNNTIWGNISVIGEDLYMYDSSAPTINLFYNDFSDFYSFCQNNQCNGNPIINTGNNINSNPHLTADSHLLQSSPCINAGNNNVPNLPSLDFEGDARIAGGTVDIGADEFMHSGLNPLNDTTEFVKQQYRDFLNRETDAGGLQYWVNIIDSGAMTRAQVIESFFWSEEFGARIAPIVRLYFAYFLRIPDYEGLMYWINAYNSGWSLEAISDSFAGSEEFQQTYGALSNEGFVNLIYQNILGRAPDPGGYAFWVGELNLGRQTRGQVMIGFSESAEYKGLTSHEVYVTMMYVGMLRRSPEQDGFNFWVDYLDSGNSGLALIDGFLNSQEYADRFE